MYMFQRKSTGYLGNQFTFGFYGGYLKVTELKDLIVRFPDMTYFKGIKKDMYDKNL